MTVRCSRPKAVDNAHIDAGNSTQLHACLRYTCKPGYKRKAGTSGLIQCVLHDSKPVWTPASLQCIRKISPGGFGDAVDLGMGWIWGWGGGGRGVAVALTASPRCVFPQGDPALPLQTPSPELPPVLPTMRTSQRGEEGANAALQEGVWG